MNPELETLDQLLGGDLPLTVIRSLFDDDSRFARAIRMMLDDGEVQLLTSDGDKVERWRWPDVLAPMADKSGYRLDITSLGAKRIG